MSQKDGAGNGSRLLREQVSAQQTRSRTAVEDEAIPGIRHNFRA
jgi:hypothetical protein